LKETATNCHAEWSEASLERSYQLTLQGSFAPLHPILGYFHNKATGCSDRRRLELFIIIPVCPPD